jgi:hypothetical protein
LGRRPILKKKLKGQCPCGYVFDTFTDEKTAIVEVRLHFERYHKNYLPFGITDAEALALLNKTKGRNRQEVTSSKLSNLKNNPIIA